VADRPPGTNGRRAARTITYGVVALAALVAILFTRPIPERRPAEALLRTVPRAPSWVARTDTLARGETLSGLLGRAGLARDDVADVLESATALDARRVPAGIAVTTRALDGDSLPREIVFHLAVDRVLRVARDETGWTSTEERLPWTTDTIAVRGEVRTTLYAAFDDAASGLPSRARSELAWSLADIYEYKVDMSRDLQPGDAFRVLVERQTGPQGIVRTGRILAATFTLSGREIQAVRHEPEGRKASYYDQDGKSMRAAFLRAPLEFRRISSVFGRRRHPILGTTRAHKGTDYAAGSGTPVRAIGDGIVVHAGWRGGYGNTLEIRHRNGYLTRYAHLRGFARGVRAGRSVGIGQTVAYVGSTGLSSGPHLHFEVLVSGVQRDPRTALTRQGGEPLASSERAAFQSSRSRLLALLDRVETSANLASRQ
jgi:murein DD-endopeptidase MepM/ murein hydrolase activator NlpD